MAPVPGAWPGAGGVARGAGGGRRGSCLMSSSFRREDNMEIGWAILLIGVAALFAALLLLVNGVVYAELMNSESPPGLGGGQEAQPPARPAGWGGRGGECPLGPSPILVRVRFWSQSDTGPVRYWLVFKEQGSSGRRR